MAEFVDTNRKPCILYAVIDVSGSMGSDCGQGESAESDGYSRLDLVKHTLNTIIYSLSSIDELCVITFSDNAAVRIPRTKIVEDNKETLKTQLDQVLHPDCSTNLWDGIRVAIDEIAKLDRKITNASHNIQILLLTDGESNINPPNPIPVEVADYLQKHCPKNRFPVLNTFGYGNQLESELLYTLAEANDGVFGFLPDATMVGTVFVNTLSSILCGALQRRTGVTKSTARPLEDISTKVANTVRSLCLNTPPPANTHTSSPTSTLSKVSQTIRNLGRAFTANPTNNTTTTPTTRGGYRGTNSQYPTTPSPPFAERQALLHALVEDIETLQSTATDETMRTFLTNLLLDIRPSSDANNGQIDKAIQEKYFTAWGKHYLFCVATAFARQICLNFKDHGIQSFQTPASTLEQTRIEDVFVSLPPPTPSIAKYDATSHAYVAAAAPTSMRNYYNAYGGCFTGTSSVYTMVDNTVTITQVAELRPGMVVQSNKGLTTIEAVVKLAYRGSLYRVGEYMYLTAYHPVLIDDQAHFPCELAAQPWLADYAGYVYDLVLSDRGIIQCPFEEAITATTTTTAKSFFVATFGHTMQREKFAHEYFGSEKIVEDLKQHRDWSNGYLVIEQPQYQRGETEEGETYHRITKLVFSS